MPAVKKVAITFVGTVLTGLYLAAPAGADPGFDPCHSTITFICRMLPIMPDLDHDVDLTQDPDGLTGGQSPGNQPGTSSPTNQPGAGLGGN
jgi:hypothetical protein